MRSLGIGELWLWRGGETRVLCLATSLVLHAVGVLVLFSIFSTSSLPSLRTQIELELIGDGLAEDVTPKTARRALVRPTAPSVAVTRRPLVSAPEETFVEVPSEAAAKVVDVPATSGLAGRLPQDLKEEYLRELRRLTNQAKVYPLMALRQRQEGRVTLRLKVLPGGQIGEVVLAESSSHAILDQAAQNLVRRLQNHSISQDMAALPGFEVLLPVDYILKR